MPAVWRLLDTGPAPAAWNLALDSVLLRLRAEGAIPDTLHFLQYEHASVLVGRHQTVEREVRTAYCHERGIEINRRLTGGGAIYIDKSQLGWEIVVSRRSLGPHSTMADLTGIICDAAVTGLKRLGLDAGFRPRNDIEVNGRKISGTGGAWEGDAILFQGTLLIDYDPEAMIRALMIPVEKLSRHGIDSARERVTSLANELGAEPDIVEIKASLAEGFAQAFKVDLVPGSLTEKECALTEASLKYYGSAKWIEDVAEPVDEHRIFDSFHHGEGGLIRTSASLDLHHRRLKSVIFSGDFFVTPQRTVLDLEANLKDCPFEEADARMQQFFNEARPDMLGLSDTDFRKTLWSCLKKSSYGDLGISPDGANSILEINSHDLTQTMTAATVLLLPYCAKSPECEYRNVDGCDECGDCSVGKAYAMARNKGILPITICDYEHLIAVFSACRDAGFSSYVGCCCQAFMEKHYQAFTDAGLSGILIDINQITCYDLKQEEEAYAGNFMGQTQLRNDLLEQVLALAPVRKEPPQIILPSVLDGSL